MHRNRRMDKQYLISREDAFPGSAPWLTSSGRGPPTSSRTRANLALMKLAHIESKILSRKKAPVTLSDTESDSKTSNEGLLKRAESAAAPSSQHTHRTFQKSVCEAPIAKSDGPSRKPSRFLKQRGPPENRSLRPAAEKGEKPQNPAQKEPARKFDAPDSDEEEMKVLLGSLMESSREKDGRRNQGLARSKDQTAAQPAASLLSVHQSSSRPSQPPCQPPRQPPRQPPHQPPHLPASQLTRDSRDTASVTSSLSIEDDISKSAFSRMECIKLASSLSRSKAGPSREELVSEASDDSRQDFRVNILSIDDLAPARWEKSNMEQKEESAGREGLSGGSVRLTPLAQHVSSTFQGATTSMEDDLATKSDVSEHLDASSASSVQTPRVPSVQSAETSVTHSASLTYTEDFESSGEPLDRTLDSLSQFSSSLETDLLHRPPPARTKWDGNMTRVMKETAVQTLDPAFTYQWASTGGMAAIGPILGGAYVDPVPIASHVVSADAIEALTAYSPAALALNDMLKQQLSLTQQFIEVSQQLHVSLLQSLDEDSFHYHTLEDAREYIRCHRPTPLTMEAALWEVKEELQLPTAPICPAGSHEDT